MMWIFWIYHELLQLVEKKWGTKLGDTVYVYQSGLMGLAGGPHYVGLFAGYPSYLFNVSFALVTIQIGSSLSIQSKEHLLISLMFFVIILKTILNNDTLTFLFSSYREGMSYRAILFLLLLRLYHSGIKFDPGLSKPKLLYVFKTTIDSAFQVHLMLDISSFYPGLFCEELFNAKLVFANRFFFHSEIMT